MRGSDKMGGESSGRSGMILIELIEGVEEEVEEEGEEEGEDELVEDAAEAERKGSSSV